MQEKYKRLLSSNRPSLVDEIDPENGLLNHLESKGVFVKRQIVTITRLPDPYKKNEAILDALCRRPDEDFQKFCDALKETDQSHVIEKYLSVSTKPPPSRDPCGLGVDLNALERLGIDIRAKDGVVDVENRIQARRLPCEGHTTSTVNGIAHIREPGEHGIITPSGDEILNHSHVKTSSLGTEEVIPLTVPADGPRLINVADIVIKMCEPSFYHSKKNESYPINKSCRGRCILINIYDSLGQSPREGADTDERILSDLFAKLHFRVCLFRNLASQQILSTLANISRDPELTDDQCFVLFVMSHGAIRFHDGVQSEVVFGSDGLPVSTTEILEPFADCPTLAGKPKLAFFQACRGDSYDQGYTQTDSAPDSSPYDNADACPPGPVSLKDFIVGFPTQSGFRSFRNTKNGSWYVNAIVHVFMEDACHMDVSAMLRRVNGIVSRWLPKTNDPKMQHRGQIASISDNLTKPYLYLFPGIVCEETNSLD